MREGKKHDKARDMALCLKNVTGNYTISRKNLIFHANRLLDHCDDFFFIFMSVTHSLCVLLA